MQTCVRMCSLGECCEKTSLLTSVRNSEEGSLRRSREGAFHFVSIVSPVKPYPSHWPSRSLSFPSASPSPPSIACCFVFYFFFSTFFSSSRKQGSIWFDLTRDDGPLYAVLCLVMAQAGPITCVHNNPLRKGIFFTIVDLPERA